MLHHVPCWSCKYNIQQYSPRFQRSISQLHWNFTTHSWYFLLIGYVWICQVYSRLFDHWLTIDSIDNVPILLRIDSIFHIPHSIGNSWYHIPKNIQSFTFSDLLIFPDFHKPYPSPHPLLGCSASRHTLQLWRAIQLFSFFQLLPGWILGDH